MYAVYGNSAKSLASHTLCYMVRGIRTNWKQVVTWFGSADSTPGTTLRRAEQQLCNRLKLVEISGKCNQTVPVLLTPDAIRGIDAIVAIRDLSLIHI